MKPQKQRTDLSRHLVAFHGLPRSGKDTGARALIDLGFHHFTFAGELYREVARNFGVSIHELQSHKWKTYKQNLLSGRCGASAKYRAMLESMGVDMKAPQDSRFHLRLWGTEYRRHTEPLYWVHALHNQMAASEEPIVITDLRFEDTEHPYLRKFAAATGRTFTVIEVTREGTKGGHISDTRFTDANIDLTIHNVEGEPQLLIDAVIDQLGLKGIYDDKLGKRDDTQAFDWCI